MKQRSIQAITDYLAHRPIGRIVTVLPVGKDHYVISIEDGRDGREHVLDTADDLELWLESFKQGRLLQPTKALCDCCCKVHSDRDIDGEFFELCVTCQAELTAMTFEQLS